MATETKEEDEERWRVKKRGGKEEDMSRKKRKRKEDGEENEGKTASSAPMLSLHPPRLTPHSLPAPHLEGALRRHNGLLPDGE